MNQMENIARIFGLELGEEFMVTQSDAVFRIMKNGLERETKDGWRLGTAANDVLHMLLTGDREIIKLPKKPWRPKDGEKVFSVAKNGSAFPEVYGTHFTHKVASFSLGWIFKTDKEAEDNKERVLEQCHKILSGEAIGKLVRPDGFDPDTARRICDWMFDQGFEDMPDLIAGEFDFEWEESE